jgi:hypothetical protein
VPYLLLAALCAVTFALVIRHPAVRRVAAAS